MSDEKLKELINGQEPIAIVKYFEWPVFLKDYANAKYVLLRMNRRDMDIYEIEIPDDMISFLMSKLPQFEEVLCEDGGVVWERMAFQEKVKELVPLSTLIHFISGYPR